MSAGWRCSRAAFAALAATTAALILHARAGGDGSALAVLVSFVGVTWFSVVAAGRPLRLLPLSLLAGGAQVYVHGVMSVLGGREIRLDGTGVLSLTIGTHPAQAMGVMPAMGGMAPDHMSGAALTSPAMLAAHGLALALTVAGLRWGEAALTTIVGLLSRAVLGIVRHRAPLPPVPAVPAVVRSAVRIARRADVMPRVLRGPPVLVA